MFIMSRGLFNLLVQQGVAPAPSPQAEPPSEDLSGVVKRRLSDPPKTGEFDWRNRVGRRTPEEIRAEQEANRPPEDALHRCPPRQYPVERRPGWLCEEDRWFGEWVYTREADGAEVRITQGGTWDDADIELDAFEAEHPYQNKEGMDWQSAGD